MSATLNRAIKSQLKLITVSELIGYRLAEANETVTDMVLDAVSRR
jgi:hypothetical protein